MATKSAKIYEAGNYHLITAKLQASGEEYDTAYEWQGMMEFSATLTQTTNKVSADDDPAYLTMAGAITGTAELKLAGISYNDYDKLFPVEKDSQQAILIGGDLPTVEFGLSFYTSEMKDGKTSINKISFPRCTATIPSKPTTSKAEDGSTITEVTISITINPYFYTDSDGTRKRVTETVINSETHKTIWEANKDKIYIPTVA